MFVAKDSTEGVKSHNFFHERAWSSLLLGLLVCLFVCFFLVLYSRHPVFHLANRRPIYSCSFCKFFSHQTFLMQHLSQSI